MITGSTGGLTIEYIYLNSVPIKDVTYYLIIGSLLQALSTPLFLRPMAVITTSLVIYPCKAARSAFL